MVQDGYTALQCAAVKGHANVVDVLVDNGAVVEAKDEVCISVVNMQNITVYCVHRS